ARAYGSAPLAVAVAEGADGRSLWDEVRWESQPGGHSIWGNSGGARWTQELYRGALKGGGPPRYVQPYSAPWNARQATAVSVPLNFLWFEEERGRAWDKAVARRLDLGTGIGVIVGVNTNPTFSDQVYVVARHAEEPTPYQAVLVWRQRES